jgi:peptidyl-prolyl cis-trans isomerase D
LTSEFMQRASTDDLQKMADKAAAEMRKDPLHPEKAAEAVGTTVIRAENLQAGDPIPGIGVAKEITDAVSALHKGEIAGPVVFSGNKVAIVSVEDYQPARQATFEEAKTDVRNKASQDKLRTILADKAKELLAKAQAAGGDLEKAGKEMGVEVKTSMDVDRSGAIEGVGSAASISDIFTKPEGALLGPLVVPTGQLVAKVVLKTPANLADLPKQSEGLRTALKQKRVADRSTMFEEGLKKRLAAEGKLKINQDVLTRLVQNYTSRT